MISYKVSHVERVLTRSQSSHPQFYAIELVNLILNKMIRSFLRIQKILIMQKYNMYIWEGFKVEKKSDENSTLRGGGGG